jgi:hypothetical protein
MRIYIKTNDGKVIKIPAPLWLVRGALGLGNVGVRIAKSYAPEESRQYIDMIDFHELRKGFDVLKHYKGLKLVDIKSSDGTVVEIII